MLRGLIISSFLKAITHGKWEGGVGKKEDLCLWIRHALYWRGTVLGSSVVTGGPYTPHETDCSQFQELIGSKAKPIHSRKTVTSCLSHTLGISSSCTGPEHRQPAKGDALPSCPSLPDGIKTSAAKYSPAQSTGRRQRAHTRGR